MTAIEIAKEEALKAGRQPITDVLADYLIWEHTGFPEFWNIGLQPGADGLTPEQCMRKQLQDYFAGRVCQDGCC